MRDAIVVGGGVIGATVANLLTRRGKDVLLLDDGRPNAGTPPSGGHLRPSWFGGMSAEEYRPAMGLLDEAWGLREEEFEVHAPLLGTVTSSTVYRVDTDAVVAYPRTAATVTALEHLGNFPLVRHSLGEDRCRLLVVAAGAWCGDLLDDVTTKVRQGVSFRLRGVIPNPVIRPWAPYKQVVVHQQGSSEVWAGDGSALKPENWTAGRTAECLARCRGVLPSPYPVLRTLTGWRPYCEPEGKSDPCLLRRVGPRAWLATGAGKMGTIAAGWVARRVLDAAAR